MKRIISLILVLAACLGLFSVTATAADMPFTDVKPTAYYADAVTWAVENNITTGKTATRFAPDDPCTRAQVVTFLWRACGEPEPTMTSHGFGDVKASAYYNKAVLWAVENGITTGKSATRFAPDDPCTRAQVVTFLHRTAGEPEPTMTSHGFDDVKASAYYNKAVLWAVENNITTGKAATRFAPDDTCTRAQVVTFLYRAKDLLDPAEPLVITQQPQDAWIHPDGAYHTFSVAVSGGTEPYTYQWQYQNSLVAEFTDIDEMTRAFCSGFQTASMDLELYPTDFTRGTQFRCVITDARGQEIISDAVGIREGLHITQQPQNATVNLGETAMFTVAASGGTAPYSYHWEYSVEGGPFYRLDYVDDWVADFRTAALSVEALSTHVDEFYQFRCVITDAAGTVITSDPAVIVERENLHFTLQPQSQETVAGEWCSFVVNVAGGLPSYHYQWYMKCDGMGTSVAMDDADWATGCSSNMLTVKLTEAQLEENYRFFCVVSDEEGLGDITSDTAYLRERFHISSQPQNVSAYEDVSVSFSVEVRGAAIPVAYQWQYSTDGGDSYVDLQTSDSWALAPTSERLYVYAYDFVLDGQYLFRCKVTDNLGNTLYSDEAQVIRIYPPRVVTQTQNVRVNVGEEAVFTVEVAGGVPPYTYQWYEYDFYNNSWLPIPGAISATLTQEMDQSHLKGAIYYCVITDDCGVQVSSSSAYPILPLTILKQPVSVAAGLGEFVSFTAYVGGGEALYTYRWEADLDGDRFGYLPLVAGSHFEHTNYASLWFYVNADDYKYSFRCVVTDEEGNTVTTDPVRVKIK